MIPLVCIVIIIVFFKLPYSKTASAFHKKVEQKKEAATLEPARFTERDIQELPIALQRYFRYCGFLGTPKMYSMTANFHGVDFVISEKKTIQIDYTQYNLVAKPERFAYISSSLYGIPFEGYDAFENGIGSMKGILAKQITLFDQGGKDMDRACLVTILAECLLVPHVALQDYISWEEIDDTHAKASISYYGISAEGIFTFDPSGALVSFTSKDRVATDMKGNSRTVPWSATMRNYQEKDGILRPTLLQSFWHYPEGDCCYFNENQSPVEIEFQ